MQNLKKYLFIGGFIVTVALIVAALSQFIVPSEQETLNFNPPAIAGNVGTFLFTASGDFGASFRTDKVLDVIKSKNPVFHIALGDFAYEETESEEEWCAYVKKHVGKIPFQLIAGNHDSGDELLQINKYVKCLPNAMQNLIGEYGKQYYFDFPAENPIARFVLVSPGLNIDDENYIYDPGTERAAWVKSAVDDARTKNIPWVIASMHKDCIAPTRPSCEMGHKFMTYLIENVDLIIQSHSHMYARSKQLFCLKLGLYGVEYDESCVRKNALNNIYKRGAGAVAIIAGTGGRTLQEIESGNALYQYFVTYMGIDRKPTAGFAQFEVSEKEIRGEFVPAEGLNFRDAFVITR